VKKFFIAFVMLYVLGGCSTPQDEAKKLSLPQVKSPNTAQSLTTDKLEVRVQKKGTPSSYEIWRAKQGYMFFVLEVTITNHYNTSFVLMPKHFNLISSTGKIYGVFQTKEYKGILHKTRVKARNTVKGTLLFEVPQNEMYTELVFAPFHKNIIIPIK
jgi:hypothetical protein